MNGARMRDEMAEQPRVLRDLVAGRDTVVEAVRRAVPRDLRGVVLVARGSSDNAAVHGRYLLEAVTGRPVALAAPSLQTRYGVTPQVEGFLAVGISQSGATPEIVTALAAFGAGGAATVAITNDPASELAATADTTVLLDAGEEVAIPATKTFTAQLAAVCLLAEALDPAPLLPPDGWSRAIAAVEAVLATPEAVEPLAGRIADAERVVTLGRGLVYGAALEVALKLAETTGIPVEGTSPFDLRHGPIASIGERTHTVLLSGPGPVADDLRDTARQLRDRGASVAAIVEDPALVDRADLVVPVPAGVPEALLALPLVVRGQQLAWRAALDRGSDPDAPFSLSKITRTT